MPNLVVAKRFCGPPYSANGGYFSGMVAAQVPRPSFVAEAPSMQPLSVRLKAPPPLDTPLAVVPRPDGGVEIREGDRLVGGVAEAQLELSVPPPVAYDEAVDASRNYMGFTRHPFPACFVCGPHRRRGDGLCIYAGPVSGRNMVAAPWTPDESLDRGDGKVGPEFMWAALDCPGYYAVTPDDRMMLLAQFTVELDRPIEVGERCVVVGWRIQSNGSRHEAGTALYGGGELRGRAWSLWIEPRSTR